MNKISIHIEADDLTAYQANALATLALAFGNASDSVNSFNEAAEKVETEEKPKATRNRSKKTETPAETNLEVVKDIEVKEPEAVATDTGAVAEEEDDLMGDTAPEAETAPAITIVEIRAKVSDKQAVHKEAIRAKLGELGAANVTALKESDYQTFYAFLNTLV